MIPFPSLNFGAVFTASGMAKLGQIIIGDLNGKGHVYRRDGTALPGWPQMAVVPGASHPTAIESTPAVGDLDGDGRKEIVVGVVSICIAP